MRTLILFFTIAILSATLHAQLGNWQQTTSAAAWSPTGMRASVVFNNKMWVLGGFQDASIWSSTNGLSWTQETANAPWGKRYEHAAVVYNNHIWVFGGIGLTGQAGYRSDVWFSPDGVNWGLATASAPWGPRARHGAVVHNNRMWIIGGGYNGGQSDVWSSNNGVNWTLETAAAPWTVRGNHGVAAWKGRLWILGGNSGMRQNDVWSSANGVTWTLETGAAAWSKRYGHTVTIYNDRLWVVAGDEGGTYKNDAWASTDGVHWSLEMNGTAFTPRRGHTSVAYDNKLWAMGGYDGSTFMNDVWSYNEPPSVRLTVNGGGDSSFFPPTHNLVAMDLTARAQLADSSLVSLTFTYTGTMSPSLFTNIELFLDNNGDGMVDQGDTSLGTELMFNSRVTFTSGSLVSLTAGANTRILLAVSTSSGIALSQNMRFQVTAATDVAFGSGIDVTQYPLIGTRWINEGIATRQFGPALVGSGSSNPFNFGAGSGRFQTAYAAGEMLAPPGTLITTVRVLGTNNVPPPVYGQLRLRIAHTGLHPNTLTPDFDDNYSGTLQECLGPVDFTPTRVPTQDGAWYVFPLSQPFVYNGTQGIVIDWSYSTRSDVGFLVGFDTGRKRIHVNGGSAFSPAGTETDAGNYGLSLTLFPPGSVAGLLISRPLAAAIPNNWMDTVTGTAFSLPTLLHYEAMNIGTSGINFTGAQPVSVVAGVGAPQVVVTQQPAATLAPSGGLTTFEISVTPAVLGPWSAVVTVLSNDAYSPYTFTISGDASTPHIPTMVVRRKYAVIPNGGVDPGLGSGSLAVSLSYSIHNTGTGVLNLTAPVIVFASSNCTVLIDQPLSNSIAINGYTTFGLFVSVNTQGPYSFSIEIASDDPANNPYTWTYNGDIIPTPAPTPSSGGCAAQAASGGLWVWLASLAAVVLGCRARKRGA